MAKFKKPNFGILQCGIPKFQSNKTKIIGAFGPVRKVLYNNKE